MISRPESTKFGAGHQFGFVINGIEEAKWRAVEIVQSPSDAKTRSGTVERSYELFGCAHI